VFWRPCRYPKRLLNPIRREYTPTAHWHGPTLWKDAQGPAKSMVINSKCSFCLEALTNWIGTVQQAAGVYRVLQKQKKKPARKIN
jgi:hypothetical protein